MTEEKIDMKRVLNSTLEFYFKEIAEEILWNFGIEGEKISPKELGQKMGINRHLAWGILQSLQDDGKAEPFSQQEGGGWMLIRLKK